MSPWTVIKKALLQCGGATSSCLGPYPTVARPEFHISCRQDDNFSPIPRILNIFLRDYFGGFFTIFTCTFLHFNSYKERKSSKESNDTYFVNFFFICNLGYGRNLFSDVKINISSIYQSIRITIKTLKKNG